MNTEIKKAIEGGRAILFFGAGASSGCKTRLGNNLLLGSQLAKSLAEKFGLNYNGEALGIVYKAVSHRYNDQVISYLNEEFKNVKPSEEYKYILKFPFFRIYSLNIDDGLEKAAIQCNKEISVFRVNSRVVDFDQTYQRLDYIKLNGDVNNPENGFVFSPEEYAREAVKESGWYQELATDYNRFTFIFIGTNLNEPAFKHHVERYRQLTGSRGLKSYLIVPEITEIEKFSFASDNIDCIEGTFESFVHWLKSEFSEIPTSRDVFNNNNPGFLSELGEFSKDPFDIFPVSRKSISLLNKEREIGNIKNFYKGTKPTWHNIIDNVPALLEKVDEFYQFIKSDFSSNDLFLLLGPAGSGKTTGLMQLAVLISDATTKNVYFVEEFVSDFENKLIELDRKNSDVFFVFIERIADVAKELRSIISNNKTKAVFVTAENIRIWGSRAKLHLSDKLTKVVDLTEITDKDADNILNKIERYGHWTRLEKMSKSKRKNEILKKSKKQLLIGLIETTLGQNYNEIIKNDYEGLGDDKYKYLLLLVGIATENRTPASVATISRSLKHLGFSCDVEQLVTEMEGVVYLRNNKLYVRHRVYAERLFENFISPNQMFDVIGAYLQSFSVYKFPLARNISRSDFAIYKHLSNNKTLRKYFRGDKNLVISLYKQYEKEFEQEGLFLLQYSLALRSYGCLDSALEKVLLAHYAFPGSHHIEHALAQTKLIIACNTGNKQEAFALFSEAQEVLQGLQAAAESNRYADYDSYPLVTLVESHIQLLITHSCQSEAIEFAKHYYNKINKNRKLEQDQKVNILKSNLLHFYSSGNWVSDDFK